LVGAFPGFAYPSGELQPGLIRVQALRAVRNGICCANHPAVTTIANNTRRKQPGEPVNVQALRAVRNGICCANRPAVAIIANNTRRKQPGEPVNVQALRAVRNGICCANHPAVTTIANNTRRKQPGGPVNVIAQAEAPRRGKRSLGKRQPKTPSRRAGAKIRVDTENFRLNYGCYH